MYVLKKRLQVEIVFPISPFLSHDELHRHYQYGIISWETYSQHACANASLPYEQLAEPSTAITEPGDSNQPNAPDDGDKPPSKDNGASKNEDSTDKNDDEVS